VAGWIKYFPEISIFGKVVLNLFTGIQTEKVIGNED
jgi:hypothetical protein